MALQIFKIAEILVQSPQDSVEFTSIPQGYTDLILYTALRDNRSSVSNTAEISFNGSTSSFSGRVLYTDGYTNAGSYSSIPRQVGSYPATNSTANTFGNGMTYIPNYAGSNNKSFFTDSVGENNGSESYLSFAANLWSNTSAITSIKLTPYLATFFSSGSSATLYGIL